MNSYELPVAASLLFQGYYLIKAFNEGVEEIVDDEGRVIVSRESMKHTPAEKDPTKLFEMFETEQFEPSKIYRISCDLNSSLKNDLRLKDIFDRLSKRDYNLSIKDAVYASRKVLEVCK